MSKEVLFNYIKQHIDEDGIYTEATLPDDPSPLIPRPLGMEDALFYSGLYPQDDLGFKELSAALDAALLCNSEATRKEIFGCLDNLHLAAIYDQFTQHYTENGLLPEAYPLGKELFYTGTNREHLKFAILVLGFYGMNKVKEIDLQLWEDVVTVAHCEEFTVYFVNACILTSFCPNKEYWQLVACVNNWGKIALLQEMTPRSEAEKRWLIMNGYDFTINYPALAPRLAELTQLQSFLEWAEIEPPALKGALAIICNLLQLIDTAEPQELQKDFNMSSLNLKALVYNVLYHASRHQQTPLLTLQLLQLNTLLRDLAEEQEWTYITSNDCHLLMAQADGIIYGQDWAMEIDQHLFEGGQPDYLLADLAYELEKDIWQPLFDYYLEHPEEIALFPYLLSYEGEQRSEKVIRQIERNFEYYADSQEALVVPLRYLRDHPGQGSGLICQALTGMYDFPRGYACAVINYWGPEFMTPDFHEALKIALELNNHPAVTSHIQDLIIGKFLPPEPGFADAE